MTKKICVVDTCSLIVLGHLEVNNITLGSAKIRRKLENIFTFYIPDFITKNEYEGAKNKYEQTYDVDFPIDLLTNVNIIKIKEYKCCLDLLNYWMGKNSLTFKDEGEKNCLALSLYLSRRECDDIFLLTDDRAARSKIIDEFIQGQKIGNAMSFPDIVLYVFSRVNLINKDNVRNIFQEYYRLMPPRQINDVKKEEYYKWSEEMCKELKKGNINCSCPLK